MENSDQINYKGHFIVKLEHPKLSGKYEVYTNDTKELFLGRESTISECKKLI